MVVGELINSRYDIKMLIGDGGMANVYLAYDRVLRKNVAIKMLRYELSKDESFIKRFNREATQVTQLEHPNIVASYAVGEYKEQPFIVMEYIRGRTLKDYLREVGPLTSSEATFVMIQICQGIDAAHRHGIIHRDLKSQNIMIDDELNVKITDFGIALSSNEADMTQTNTIMGSVHYLAPELARGSLATTASDIYSIGILLYEFLTGMVPFKGEGAVNIALQHMENEVPSVQVVNSSLSSNFDHIIKRATAKKPAHRYLNVLEMISDLRVAHIEGSVGYVESIANATKMKETKPVPQRIQSQKTKPKSNAVQPVKKTKPIKEGKIAYKDRRSFSGLSLINGILYTALLAIFAVVYIMIVIEPANFETDHARVPNVIGMTVSEARDALDDAGFENAHLEVREIRNTLVPVGEVFRSNPGANVQVRLVPNRVIRIYVATHEAN